MGTEKIPKESDRKREETISQTSRCLTRSSKPEKNDPFNIIPEDLKVEILMRLPAKSIAKLSLVSESCLSITYRKDFKNLYMNRSLTQPRLLYTIYCPNIQKQYFQSCSQKNTPSDKHRVNILNSSDRYDFSPPVHGLIHCTNGDNDVMIGNPTTGQFVTLLRYKASDGSIFSFLGYDPVNDVYKVLCLKVRFSLNVMSTEHQVLTLGLGSTQKWRTIECKHPDHYPTRGTKGICINGVVYYLAQVRKIQSLVCFDLTNEDFTVIELRESGESIANYNGKVALSNVLDQGQFDFWVLEDAKKQEWLKVFIFDPCWWFEYRLCRLHRFKFRGTLSTGELIFSPYSSSDSFCLLCYYPKEEMFEEVKTKVVRDSYASVEVFLNHIESPMVLSKVIS